MKRFYKKIFLPFIPNPFCYAEVSNNLLRYKEYWKKDIYMELSDITIETHTTGISGALLGHGSAIISSAASPVTLNSMNAKGLKRYIEFTRNTQGKPETVPSSSLPTSSSVNPNNKIPAGVELSDKILVLPEHHTYLTNWLFHYAYNTSYENEKMGSFGKYSDLKTGDWVNKGDVLYNFNGNKIYSPVSGIAIWAEMDFHQIYKSNMAYITILLPKGEVPEVSAEALYQEFYRCLATNSKIQKTFKHLSKNQPDMPDKWKSDIRNKDEISNFLLNIFNEFTFKYQYISAEHPNFIVDVLQILLADPKTRQLAVDLKNLDNSLNALAEEDYKKDKLHSAKFTNENALKFNPDNPEAKILRDKITDKLREAA